MLSDINLSLKAGDSVSIVGPSGSGKSTLLYILGALEPPTAGTVLLNGRNPFELDEKSLASFRNEEIGFVFQDHHLLPQCSVLENVLIPTLVARDGGERHARASLRSCSNRSASAQEFITGLTNCRAGRNSGWRWLAHWSGAPGWCSATSPQGTWTMPPRKRSRNCS